MLTALRSECKLTACMYLYIQTELCVLLRCDATNTDQIKYVSVYEVFVSQNIKSEHYSFIHPDNKNKTNQRDYCSLLSTNTFLQLSL